MLLGQPAFDDDVSLAHREYRIVRSGVTPSSASATHQYTYSFGDADGDAFDEETNATGATVPVLTSVGGNVVDGIWYGFGSDNLEVQFEADSYSLFAHFSTGDSSGVSTGYTLCHLNAEAGIRIDPNANLVFYDDLGETDTGINISSGGASLWLDYESSQN